MTLIDKIYHMLDDRADLEVLDSGDGQLTCVQLRRVWNKRILNEGGFNPVEREAFFYYGQYLIIAEPRYVKKTHELVKEQRDMATKYGRVGVQVIFAQSLDDVVDAIGPEPTNLGEFLGRKEK